MMSKRFLIILLLAGLLVSNAAAQSSPGTINVKSSVLLNVELPTGAMRVKKESSPEWITDFFADAARIFKDGYRVGEPETLLWGNENFTREESVRVMREVEARLGKSGWKMDGEEERGEKRTFLLVREQPHRVMLGLFVAGERIFVFTAAELLPLVTAAAPSPDTSADYGTITAIAPNQKGGQGTGSIQKIDPATAHLRGYWETVSSAEGAAKKQLKYSYQFYADGTLLRNETVTEVSGACRSETVTSYYGRVVPGEETLTFNFENGVRRFNSSCARGYEKSLDAKVETVKYTIKETENKREFCPVIGGAEICLKKN